MMNYQVLKAQDGCHVDGVPWCVDQYLAQPSHSGLLHCMDSLEHKHTTAFKVRYTARPQAQAPPSPCIYCIVLHCVVIAGRPGMQVLEIATELGLDHYMQLHVDDAFDFPAKMDDVMGRDTCIDMVWADFGAGERCVSAAWVTYSVERVLPGPCVHALHCSGRLDEFFGKYWARVNPNGGFVLVHSTLTNRMTRTWLQKMQVCTVRPPLTPAILCSPD
jgi:hypothetical protein